MAVHDFTSQRLFVEQPLADSAKITLGADQTNYLVNVLRLAAGDPIIVFNGRDGEWRARLAGVTKRAATLCVEARTRSQETGPDIDYLFAPLKRTRLDYMVQKAVEMGVARLRPVITRHTIAERVNLERMRGNAIEAAEQCGVLWLPEIAAPEKLDRVIAGWDASRRLVFCDEVAEGGDAVRELSELPRGPLAVLIGPEGGFAAEERDALLAKRYTTAISLGPRIMRADTAAVAALALVNAVLGDWRQ